MVLTSPYLRARRTAELMHAAGGVEPNLAAFTVDERLREKEFGVLDRLTRIGVERASGDTIGRTLEGAFSRRT